MPQGIEVAHCAASVEAVRRKHAPTVPTLPVQKNKSLESDTARPPAILDIGEPSATAGVIAFSGFNDVTSNAVAADTS